MSKTITNKWYNLIEKNIKTNKLAGLSNSGKNLATLLNPNKNRGLFVSDELKREVHQILAKDTSFNAKGVYYKLIKENLLLTLIKLEVLSTN